MKPYEMNLPEEITPADIELVRQLNPRVRRGLPAPYEAWPKWAQNDAQLVANYRRHVVASAATAKVPVSPDALDFLKKKLAEAQQTLRSREQANKCWREGTDALWREAGSKRTKAQRLLIADREKSIAARYRRDVKLFKAVIAALAKGGGK